jgi:OOP family OmpA-OmpF porin
LIIEIAGTQRWVEPVHSLREQIAMRKLLWAVSLAVLPVLSVQAQSRIDVAGGADHPLISRYAGSWLIGWRKVNFAEAKPLATLTDDIAKTQKLDKALTVEGELTELFYVSPQGRTALEVQHNYEEALKKAGAELVYSCKEDDRGCHRRGGPAVQLLLDGVVPRPQQVQPGGHGRAYAAFGSGLRLAVFKLAKGGADTWITVYSVDSGNRIKEFEKSAATYLQIVQSKAPDMGQVQVFDATQIGKGLAAEGKIALYGIYFDTGKAELKPESATQLAEMAKLLKANTSMRVFIVGHTDNQGAFDANLSLSQKRAEAVIAALNKQHGIDAKRLAARGAANISPVASNASDAGRARNRRVELVEQ